MELRQFSDMAVLEDRIGRALHEVDRELGQELGGNAAIAPRWTELTTLEQQAYCRRARAAIAALTP